MSSSYIPQHFSIEELLPPPVLLPAPFKAAYCKDKSALFRLFDYRILLTLDRLRDRYGPCLVNNWHWFSETEWKNGAAEMFRFSGWRPVDCGEGAALSEHKLFRAMDCKFSKTIPDEIWDEMLADARAPQFEYMQRIEAFGGMSWFHFDIGYHARYEKAISVISNRGDRAGLPRQIERVGG
ncbi:hypothetical protein [Halodesulfovibrio aestuarii]|uniref:hypothetical protein n=1 Tax=Halodesulfovibrio aestuarii TaxID=126333 RepID=UPI0003F93B7A